MKLLLILCAFFFGDAVCRDPECYKNITRIKRNFDTNDRNWDRRWKGGIVPYVLDHNLPWDAREGFQCAINEYHTKTCIRFVPRSSESVYLKVGYNRDVCGVAYGTNVDIGDKCGGDISQRCGVLIHEIGHILGYAHEQDRPDRDDWIEGPGLSNKNNNFETFCLMYDYLSIEHYEGQCSVYGGPWRPKKENVKACGGGRHLSVLDVNKFNAAYKCGGCLSYRWMGINCYNSNEHQLVGGGYDTDKAPFYVCRGWHSGDIIPGKARFNQGERPFCYVGHSGYEHKLYDFEVLTNPRHGGANLQWLVTPDVPRGAVPGGRTTDRTTYYIGRCFHSFQKPHSLIIGKIYANDPKKLILPFGNREIGCATEIGYLACQ